MGIWSLVSQGEKHVLLQGDRDVATQAVDIDPAQIEVVDGDAAGMGSNSRVRRAINVLFPDPVGPTIAVISPNRAAKLASRSTGRSAS